MKPNVEGERSVTYEREDEGRCRVDRMLASGLRGARELRAASARGGGGGARCSRAATTLGGGRFPGSFHFLAALPLRSPHFDLVGHSPRRLFLFSLVHCGSVLFSKTL